MSKPILIAAAAVLVFPGAALAQTSAQNNAQRANDLAAQQRLFDAQRNLNNYEQNQRFDQIQRQSETLDTRLRTEQNLRDIEIQRSLSPPPMTEPLVSAAPPATPADLAAAERRREAALQASEARLKALSDELNR
jgi:hypothetical protein